jgi:hypothetical protein
MSDKTTESDKTDKQESKDTNNEFIVYVQGIIRRYNRENAHAIFGEIMAYIKSFCLLDDEYYITGSYVMGLNGLKNISNISVSMTGKNYVKVLEKIQKFGNTGQKNTSNGQFNFIKFDFTKFFKHHQDYNDDRNEFYLEIFQQEKTVGFPNNNFSFEFMKDNNGLQKDTCNNYYMSINKLKEWKQKLVELNQDASKHTVDINKITNFLEIKFKYLKYKNKYLTLKSRIST